MVQICWVNWLKKSQPSSDVLGEAWRFLPARGTQRVSVWKICTMKNLKLKRNCDDLKRAYDVWPLRSTAKTIQTGDSHVSLFMGQHLPVFLWQYIDISVYSQLGQGGLEKRVRVVAVDHLSFSLLGFRSGGDREGGRRRVWRLPLGQQLPLSLYVLPLLVDALLLPV